MRLSIQSAIAALLLCSAAVAGDWPRFRGPNGSGVSLDKERAPAKWSPKENLKWKVALPGPGVSCPIVVGDRVFVTCYSGYGVDRSNVGRQENLKRHLVCVDRKMGEILWDKTVSPFLPEDPYTGMGIPEHGYASHSPVSDGERVYVFFGKTGALAFDMDGNQLWHKELGTESDRRRWGSASSPIVYKNLLIVTASAESEALVALDTKTGEQVWRKEATGFANVWGSPVLAKIDDERTDLVLGVPYEVWGFDPATGKLRWYSEAVRSDQFSPSIIEVDGSIVAMAASRGGGGSVAVRPGGKGDVTASHVAWTGREAARYATPVAYKGRLYNVSSDTVAVIDAKSGERLARTRLEGGSNGGGGGRRGFGGDYASPVIADGKLYYVKRNGDMFVFKLGDELEQLSVNRVTSESEVFSATPAISKGQLFIRSNKQLYCVADSQAQ